MISLVAVIPFISIVLGESQFYFFSNVFIQDIYSLYNKNQIIYFCTILLVSAFLIKSTLLIFLIWLQSKFIVSLRNELSEVLFDYYMKYQPFLSHVMRSSPELIRNINSYVTAAIQVYLNSLLLIIWLNNCKHLYFFISL